jgi:hypothetical protein
MTTLRAFQGICISCMIGIWLWFSTPEAIALVPVQLHDLSYQDCPPEMAEGAVVSGSIQAANCFIVTGTAENKSGKTVVNADIFGHIYDANDNDVMPNRNRVGSIEEVPPGTSEFQIQISVAANQPLPLQFKQFKASGFTGKVRR